MYTHTERVSDYSSGTTEYASPSASFTPTEVACPAANARLHSGMHVQIVAGPLAGTTGIAAIARGINRWLVRLHQAGCYVEIDERLLEQSV